MQKPKVNGAEAPSDRLRLVISLVAGLVMGVLFIFLVPPWQHYDEPNHFEYVWLAANLDHLPGPEDRNEELNRQVLLSMDRYHFFDERQFFTFAPDQKVNLQGYSQLTEPPFYYLAASLPVRFLSNERIEIQLISARFISLIFYLITILSAWGIAKTLTSKNHPIRWMLPLSLVFLPAFTDLMTAVNSDSAAVAFASLFLWAAVKMLKDGFSWASFAAMLVTGVLAWFTKNTAYFVLPLIPLVVAFSLLPPRRHGWVWLALFVIGIAGFVLSLARDEPYGWLRATLQPGGMRVQNNLASVGEHAFALDTASSKSVQWWPLALQSIPINTSRSLAGETLTFGFWAWADKPNVIRSPIFTSVNLEKYVQIDVEKTPRFYAFEIQVPEEFDRAWVSLDPHPSKEGSRIYYDGLVLVLGQMPADQQPVFQSNRSDTGEWGGVPFENILRNASAETRSVRFRSKIDAIGSRFLPDNVSPSLILQSLVDVKGTRYIHQTAIDRLFRSFWGKFAWGHIGLAGWDWVGKPYSILAVFTLLGLFGAFVAIIHRDYRLNWSLVMVLFISLSMVWGLTSLRGIPFLTEEKMYLSVARHAYPVIIPTILIFCVGWYEIGYLLDKIKEKLTQRTRTSTIKSTSWHEGIFVKLTAGIFLGCLILLTWAAVASIASYYNWYSI